MDEFLLVIVALLCAPLSLYLLVIPFVLGLLLWFGIQDGTTRLCRRLGWRRPNWAVNHTEKSAFNSYEGA
jgi:hypothetical protein